MRFLQRFMIFDSLVLATQVRRYFHSGLSKCLTSISKSVARFIHVIHSQSGRFRSVNGKVTQVKNANFLDDKRKSDSKDQ